MSERVLAACTQSGNRPSVTVLDDGRVLVTGELPDGSEATVTLPAEVFDRAARAWLRRRSVGRRVVSRLLAWAAVGTVATYAATGLGASSLVGHLIGLGITLVGAAAVGWREGGRDA